MASARGRCCTSVCACVSACMRLQGWDQGLVGMCVGERVRLCLLSTGCTGLCIEGHFAFACLFVLIVPPQRKLVIPSGLGYGAGGSPPKIPGGATLVFEVELLEIQN